MIKEHRIKSKLKVSRFLDKIEKYGKENIESTAHTFFRLSEKQRKIYTENELKRILVNCRPLEVWVQNNDNLAVIYNYNKKYLRILLDLTSHKIYIVTFYILNKQQRKEIRNG